MYNTNPFLSNNLVRPIRTAQRIIPLTQSFPKPTGINKSRRRRSSNTILYFVLILLIIIIAIGTFTYFKYIKKDTDVEEEEISIDSPKGTMAPELELIKNLMRI